VKNSDFATDINEIYVELSENSQRYVIECCEPESDGTINGFGAGCCKRRGGGRRRLVVRALGTVLYLSLFDFDFDF
jgi:hypothetical protein